MKRLWALCERVACAAGLSPPPEHASDAGQVVNSLAIALQAVLEQEEVIGADIERRFAVKAGDALARLSSLECEISAATEENAELERELGQLERLTSMMKVETLTIHGLTAKLDENYTAIGHVTLPSIGGRERVRRWVPPPPTQSIVPGESPLLSRDDFAVHERRITALMERLRKESMESEIAEAGLQVAVENGIAALRVAAAYSGVQSERCVREARATNAALIDVVQREGQQDVADLSNARKRLGDAKRRGRGLTMEKEFQDAHLAKLRSDLTVAEKRIADPLAERPAPPGFVVISPPLDSAERHALGVVRRRVGQLSRRSQASTDEWVRSGGDLDR